MIDFLHISKSFQGKEILHGVTFSIEDRQTVCIIGPSGCGKTTLLRCIAGLEKLDDGVVHGDGFFQRKSHDVGIVFQRFNLFENMTVLKNITIAPIHVLKMSEQDAEDMAMTYLKMVGMSGRATYYPSQLSSGQQQRVAIARCLAMKPKILLLDEPLAALDPISRREVMDVLRKLRKEITMIIVSHDLDAVSELADRIIFMHEGHICEDGTPEQILNRPSKEETRHFISQQKNLFYTIESNNFDHPELNARIEHYCNRFGLGRQASHYVQLAVEEQLNLLTLDDKIDIILSKADNEVRMSLDFNFKDRGKDILSEENIEDDNFISLNIIQGLCDYIKEHADNGMRNIHLELNQDRLLLK